jgi:predicted phage terminase large subunit-like protein
MNPLLIQPTHPDRIRQDAIQAAAAQQLARRALARRHLLHFTRLTTPGYEVGWVHKEITELLDAFIEACERKLGPRLIIQLPPRIGKSELISRKFPAFILGKHPEWEVVCATYNQDLASDFGREVRSVLIDPIYAELFPEAQIRQDSNAIDYVKFEQRGSYTAVGIGGALTGRGAHVLIIDDPVKNREDADSELVRETTWKWYQTVARTRLAPGGGIVICQTRWHEEDLTGKILLQEKANPDGDRWHVYSFPAIATQDEKHRKAGEALHPDRWPIHEYEKLRATLDPREWSALYQQNPTPPDGIAFKREWFHYATPPKNINWYVSTDFAIGEKDTNDRTVLLPFGVAEDGTIYVDMPIRDRMDAMTIVEKLCDILAERKPVQVAIENVHISKSIGPFLRKRMQERRIFTATWGYTATRDKLARSASLRGRLQQGKIRFHPQFKHIIEEEFIPFPAGRHDDAVDALSVGMLMLDTLMKAAPDPTPAAATAPEWSMTWMKERIARSSGDDQRHVPRMLNGRERKTKAAPKWSS